jgi:hypothetical protein
VFQVASTRRLLGPSELFPPRPVVVPLDTRGSPAIGCSKDASRRADRVYGVRGVCPDEPDVDARHTPGDPGFRALLRPGVRHFERRVSATRSRCSLGLCPLRGLPTRPLGLTPPLVHLPACRLRRGAANGASGCQSGRAWAWHPEGATSASVRFATSYEQIDDECDTQNALRTGAFRASFSVVAARFRC